MSPDDCVRALDELRAEIAAQFTALRDEIRVINDELLTTRQAAKSLGMTEGALRTKVWRGLIKPVRIGRSVRFRRSDLKRISG
jgi:excisionase family DNA binding protein